MIPLTLQISGFLSYRDPVSLDFTGFDLACISGSNGAGKSSLLDAITWALFGQARRRDDALINSGAKAAEVVFDFMYEGNVYRVRRSKAKDKTGLLELSTRQPDDPAAPPSQRPAGEGGRWKPLTERSLRETEERIKRILRMDYETFINASFFLQGKADQFAQQRPGDRKAILSKILGLEAWEDYRERAAAQRKETETEVAAIDGRLNEIAAELAEGPARQVRLAELEQSLGSLAVSRQAQADALENLRKLAASLAEQRRLVETLQRQLQAAITGRDRQAQVLAGRREEREAYQRQLAAAPEIEAAYHSWQSARGALEGWESLAAQYLQQQSRRTAFDGNRDRAGQPGPGATGPAGAAAGVGSGPGRNPPGRQLEQAQVAVSPLAAHLVQQARLRPIYGSSSRPRPMPGPKTRA